MGDIAEPVPEPDPLPLPAPPLLKPQADQDTLRVVAACVIIAAASWYLLKELAPLLRPLLLAVFLAYVIVPGQHRLRRMAGPWSILFYAGLTVAGMLALTLLIYGSAVELNEELPRLMRRSQAIGERMRQLYLDNFPVWLLGAPPDAAAVQAQMTERLRTAIGALADGATDSLTATVLVGIYLVFLMIEAGRVRSRIKASFPSERAEQILVVIARINDAMANFLRIKVKSSLVLAAPVVLILWSFNIRFALMWGVLTFLLNFIPYLGSIIACSLPILQAFLQLDTLAAPIAVAVLLVVVHSASAYVVEPALTGKAVGLSPVALLVALSFWSLCWGLTGMLLAVPLTVMIKIILENVEFTRPFARLLSEE